MTIASKYPWGNDWDSSRCNTEDSRIWQTTPVTQYPDGASPYGVMDMIGNVWEWCLTDLKIGKNSLEIPEILDLFCSDFDNERIFKGGDYGTSKGSAKIQTQGAVPINCSYLTGIRLVARINGWHG
jgi:formylglycine-generating enzyme required for sulfatase activity